jgi:uncharacterized membrane protein
MGGLPCHSEIAKRILVLLYAIMLMAMGVGTMGGKQTFAASATLSVLPREAVIQIVRVGSYEILA